MDAKTISEVCKTLVGQVVTVINPQSYIPTLTGYKIDVQTYKAKVIGYDGETLKILTEYMSDPHKRVKEKAYQFVPGQQIRRITISQSERFISL
ncbi:MAG: hypothetical protein KJ645_12375 [Planctomycetes bacterium]|nr:hypothetical protein [Planctomycetota bacterium]